mmetsp:Transcript_35597/g.72853  ORF Transcript_35597/g.72853 Transcript_35597/m.72853 type:complete len:230 (-) Transcript_35597:256-945(-)
MLFALRSERSVHSGPPDRFHPPHHRIDVPPLELGVKQALPDVVARVRRRVEHVPLVEPVIPQLVHHDLVGGEVVGGGAAPRSRGVDRGVARGDQVRLGPAVLDGTVLPVPDGTDRERDADVRVEGPEGRDARQQVVPRLVGGLQPPFEHSRVELVAVGDGSYGAQVGRGRGGRRDGPGQSHRVEHERRSERHVRLGAPPQELPRASEVAVDPLQASPLVDVVVPAVVVQ